MEFDRVIDRMGTHSVKWDMMTPLYGVPAQDGLAMWVADMDFAAPQCVQDAVARIHQTGVYGYYGDDRGYLAAIEWWMAERHSWQIDPNAVFTTHGLVNGTALCLDAFSQAGDGVIVMSPVYHAFGRVIRASGRDLVECPLALENGRYVLDIERWQSQLKGHEKILLFCSPHNPGGRVWMRDELYALAEFAKRNDLILVSDEIHHDLVMPGHKHIPMSTLDAEIDDRLVMMTATTKTFNIAGSHVGNVIIHDPKLHALFKARLSALGVSPNSFGLLMAEAAYSADGAAWVDALVTYLDENRRIFDEGIAQIPGLASMPLEATYLSWVDFSATGMTPKEFTQRVERDAKIAANHGPTFGKSGEDYLRFNIATPRRRVQEAVTRLQAAFGDLQ